MDYEYPIEFRAVQEQTGGWLPGPGWYVVASTDEDEYIAFCGPADLPQSEQDARRIAHALMVTSA